MKHTIFWLSLMALLLSACVQEAPILELGIETPSLTVESGQPIPFTINGQTSPTSSFITFYAGTPTSQYEDYPDALGLSVGIPFDSAGTSFVYEYTYNYHGPAKAIFVTRGYGNWSEDVEEQIFEFDLNVVDNVTSISSVTVKTPGLFGDVFEGVIDEEAQRVTFTVEAGADLSKLNLGFALTSSRSILKLGGAEIATNDVIDFSSRELTFVVEAASGVTQEWVFEIVDE